MAIPAPSYTTQEVNTGNQIASPLSTAAFHRRPFWTPVRTTSGSGIGTHFPRRWRLVYLPGQLNTTTANDLFNAWDSGKGAGGFYDAWMPPWNTETYNVRFIDTELTFDVASLIAFGCVVTLEETLAVA